MRTALILAASALLMLTSVLEGEHPSKKSADRWTPPNLAKVVGYRFKLPSDGLEGPVKSGFTLMKNDGLDTKQLESLQTNSAELTRAQVQQLTAALSSGKLTYPAACYDPHHIFVFYDAQGKPTGAIEVCFACTGVSSDPPLGKSLWYRQDFIRLARLVDALGLWHEYRTVAKYEALMNERAKE